MGAGQAGQRRTIRRGRLVAALAAAVLLAGCGSRLNPINWFSGAERPATVVEPVAAGAGDTSPNDPVAVRDPRPLVDQVAALRVEPRPGGATLVTAIGLPPTLGWFEAALVPETVAIDGDPVPRDGVMAFRFVAVPPLQPRPAGTARAREISAGALLGPDAAAATRTIVVRAARNERTARP
jgi:hypothetical protein